MHKFTVGQSVDLLTTMLRPSAAGAYEVHWHTLSADGHKTTGDYTFNVEP